MCPMSEEQKKGLERHVQTIIVAATIAMMGWVGIGVSQSRESIARMEVQIASLYDVIERIEKTQATGFSRSEAERVHNELSRRIERCSTRMDRIEESLP